MWTAHVRDEWGGVEELLQSSTDDHVPRQNQLAGCLPLKHCSGVCAGKGPARMEVPKVCLGDLQAALATLAPKWQPVGVDEDEAAM